MGMYTEFYINTEIKKTAPKIVFDVLNYLFNQNELISEENLPDHPFFKTCRWKFIGKGSSFYHIPFPLSKLEKIEGVYYLTSRSDLKNYDNEIEKFLDWIMPYIDTTDDFFIGYSRYEEDEKPTLYYSGQSISI